MENEDYEMAQRMKRARRAALKAAGKQMRMGQTFRDRSRYSRKAKHKVDYD
jgi:uncharacterized membrane protein YqiK